jgi:hypothetical protein
MSNTVDTHRARPDKRLHFCKSSSLHNPRFLQVKFFPACHRHFKPVLTLFPQRFHLFKLRINGESRKSATSGFCRKTALRGYLLTPGIVLQSEAELLTWCPICDAVVTAKSKFGKWWTTQRQSQYFSGSMTKLGQFLRSITLNQAAKI